ncbi:MAG: type I-E CRISPR-associated protein Cas5/CasD [Firmicutes bacterium]|jgi:CRISPR system Cascade subunit CasD|nr:type I-E CRISPR-associated protein Cas5/CasD [Bacillota bacterium]
MSKELLCLYLDGPLQSWGTRSRWDVRDTGQEPSKSGVIGLLGCALGYPVGDLRLQELDEQLRMGVRVERSGTILVDFQTTTGAFMAADGRFRGTSDKPYTVVSPRSYLNDASFLVILEGPESILRRCARALQEPRWPIYLGRKSCIPTRPVLGGLEDKYQSLEDALARYPWEPTYEGEVPPQQLRCIVEDPSGTHLRSDLLVVNPVRMYQYRTVSILWVDFPGIESKNGSAAEGGGM